MEGILRPNIEDIPILCPYKNEMEFRCSNKQSWQSKGDLYFAIRNSLKTISLSHCNFCDGFPLNITSKETVEHYYPKKQYPEKVYEWGNLFYCCDKCQSLSNKIIFELTLKPDDLDYSFNRYFYFNPLDGEIKVKENLDLNNYEIANNYLKRYGINHSPERKQARIREYEQHIHNFKTDYQTQRNNYPFRFVFDSAFLTYNKIK
ncbi:MAG: hypothetical protein IPI52_07115 [Bacteroidetes bacterium]|jgi:uncharacterized protein (TIGR02646 family)|nr:hypothetical protein [Bacteroidota bacterium]